MDPRRIIKSALATIQAISSHYENELEELADLPHEFTKVNQYLSLTQATLRYARDYPAWDESSQAAVHLLVTGVEKRAKMLQRVLSRVATDVERHTGDRSVLESYRIILSKLGKSYSVEALMLGILEDLNALSTNQLLKPANSNLFAELKDAMGEMSKVESSVEEADICSAGTQFTQHIASGGTGHQSHYSGQGQQINTGSGGITNYHATSINFAPSPQHNETNRQTDQSRYASRPVDGKNFDRGKDTGGLSGYFPHDHPETETLEGLNQRVTVRRGRPCRREDFQIAIICALPLEYDAVTLLFEQFWDENESFGRARGDTNSYTTGRMGTFDVVLALLPNMGTAAAAGAAASFRSSYCSLQLVFLVGICGGVPGKGVNQVHLGDVVISRSAVQYDLGKQYPETFITKDTTDYSLGRPNKNVRSLVALFESEFGRERLQQKASAHLEALQSEAVRKRRRSNYQYPGIDNDRLFPPTYRHKHRGAQVCVFCDDQSDGFCAEAAGTSCVELGCDESQLVERARSKENEPQQTEELRPRILVGQIASGSTVMKSGEHRDQVAREHNVIAFEMEGAGVWDEIPCIIVKGVCDYADSHKNDLWQPYAAAAAASVMKAALGRYDMADG
ncbi:nucleoside phosphorylase domain-containing protein [Trichoderma longibrachiatum]